jgi:hypothetical protein
MKRLLTGIALLLAATAGYLIVRAGDLDPPGPPEPTMVTLQVIYDKLDGCCTGGPYGVPKTGQTGCWDQSGTPIIPCTGTGQDGEYQMGASVVPRFTDNLDGTVTDKLTRLIWLKDANCFGQRNWSDALSDANNLASASDSCDPDLQDGSVAGDWRLPNVRELHSLIDYGQITPALPPGDWFSGVLATGYWSSTTRMGNMSNAWVVGLGGGGIGVENKTTTFPYYVWPVRGGQ